jgi:hypothetical protein
LGLGVVVGDFERRDQARLMPHHRSGELQHFMTNLRTVTYEASVSMVVWRAEDLIPLIFSFASLDEERE